MLIGMSNYGKAPDPVLALARDAARTVPGPPMGGAQALAGQPPRLFVSEKAMWLLRQEAKPKAMPPGLAAEPVFGGAFHDMLLEKGLEGSPNWAQGNQILGLGLTTYGRSEEHTSELQSRLHLVCRLLLEKKKKNSE